MEHTALKCYGPATSCKGKNFYRNYGRELKNGRGLSEVDLECAPSEWDISFVKKKNIFFRLFRKIKNCFR